MKLTITLFGVLLGLIAYGQQEQQYTQFMHNKMAINPGFAGSRGVANLTGIVRDQWIGLKGAPSTQVLNFNMPLLNQRVGIGANITRNTIGISERVTVDGVYAYRLRLAQGMLGLGVQASVRLFGMNYLDEDLVSTVPVTEDEAIPVGNRSKYVPNFGMGAYYNNDQLYVGFSIPRLLKNNLDFNETGTILSREAVHMYLMAGYLFELSEHVGFQPQILMKYVNHAPFDADVNASFIFNKKYMAGLTYRLGGSTENGIGESIDILVAAQINKHMLLGFSYDVTLSGIRDYSKGSMEGVIRYSIGSPEGEIFVNPRFF